MIRRVRDFPAQPVHGPAIPSEVDGAGWKQRPEIGPPDRARVDAALPGHVALAAFVENIEQRREIICRKSPFPNDVMKYSATRDVCLTISRPISSSLSPTRAALSRPAS